MTDISPKIDPVFTRDLRDLHDLHDLHALHELRDSDTHIPTQPSELSADNSPNAKSNWRLGIQFTGSGSEYFRIWLVNLLLTLLTLGLYYPWARVRKLRYFYANTQVDGDSLSFHGNPLAMLRGYAVIGVLSLGYTVASRFAPLAGLVALAFFLLAGPALWRASLRFRLANTGWRGLRFGFTGNLRGAYWAQLPLALGVFLVVALERLSTYFGWLAVPTGAAQPSTGQPWILAAIGILNLFLVMGLLLTFWLAKRYQHSHYVLGLVQTAFTARLRSIVWLVAKLVGAYVVIMIGIVIFAGVGSAFIAMVGVPLMTGAMIFLLGAFVIGGFAGVLKPWFVARLQNMVWNNTRGNLIQFGSALRIWPFVRLSLKNWALIVITLGLYWPFAVIATTRMRLQGMQVDLAINPALLTSSVKPGAKETMGEAAGDLFGLDVGL